MCSSRLVQNRSSRRSIKNRFTSCGRRRVDGSPRHRCLVKLIRSKKTTMWSHLRE